MARNLSILALLALVVGLPFLFQQEGEAPAPGADTIVVVSPHNESIRHEFGRGFRSWYQERYGRDVYVDWRVLGGTSEIARYLQGEYTASFRSYWTQSLGRSWSGEVQQGFANRRLVLDASPADDSPAEAARRSFLNSSVSCGIDVFFGGGTYDHGRQAQIGNSVPSRLLQTHPQWFGDGGIPETLSGERYWDAEGCWIGAVLSAYGMIYNRDSLDRLGLEEPPRQWWDLTDPRLFGHVAVCDPTKSGSITQAFEMIIQQQIQLRLAELKANGLSSEEAERLAIQEGWQTAFRIIRKIAGNARYFTDSSMKPSIDVSLGQAAVGMTIDFYGKFQVESVESRRGIGESGLCFT